MSTKNSGSTVANGSLTQLANGYVEHSGYVYFLNTDFGYKGISGAVKWSKNSLATFSDYHDGREADLYTNNYTISYKMPDADIMADGWSTGKDDYLYKDGKKYTTSICSYKPGTFLADTTAYRTGYTLDYVWTLEGTNTTYAYGAEAIAKQLGGNITVVGSWTPITYYVSYDANGGTGMVAPQTCTYDTTYAYSDGSLLSRRGYKFCGWSMNPNCTPDSATLVRSGEAFSNLSAAADTTVTLYVIWEPDEYTIRLDKAGGTGGVDCFYEMYNLRFTDTSGGQNSISSIASTPQKYGYDFAGYFTGYNGSGEMVVAGSGQVTNGPASIVVDNTYFRYDATVYANYVKKTPTIYFDFTGGTDGTPKVKAVFGEDVPMTDEYGNSVIAPRKDGVIFKGYFTERNGRGTQYYSESMAALRTCDFEKDITLYAYWVDDVSPDISLIPDACTWTNQDVGMTLRARDLGSGISSIAIYLGDLNSTPVATFSAANGDFEAGSTAEFVKQNAYVCRTEGVYTYYARVYDMAGNYSNAGCVVYLDKTAPTVYGQTRPAQIVFNDTNQTIYDQNVKATLNGDTWTTEFRVTDYK